MSSPEQPRRTLPAVPVQHYRREFFGLRPAILVDAKLWNRHGLRQSFSAREGFLLIQGGSQPREQLSHCQRIAPCILIADQASIEAMDPAELSATADFGRSVRVLVCGPGGSDQAIQNFIRMGCMGFLAADAPAALLKRAVLALARGEMWVERRIMTQMLQGMLSAGAMPKLTAREQDILRLIASGCRNREIATRLCITHETVRWHIRSLNSKLGAHDRLEMALYGRQYFE